MKTKLLKKVRKNSRIMFYPKGASTSYYFSEYDRYVLFSYLVSNNLASNLYDDFCVIKKPEEITEKDIKDGYTFTTERECIDYLHERFLSILREKYPTAKKKKLQSRIRQVWP